MLYISKVDYNKETVDISDSNSGILVSPGMTFKDLKVIVSSGKREIYGAEIVDGKYLCLNTFAIIDVLYQEEVYDIEKLDSYNRVIGISNEYIKMIVHTENIKSKRTVIYSCGNSKGLCYVAEKGYTHYVEEAKRFTLREAKEQAKYMTISSKRNGSNRIWRTREVNL